MKKTFTISIDTDALKSSSDEYLGALWHIAQFLRGEYGDDDACEVVRALGIEVIRRWIADQPVPLFNIQAGDQLRKRLHCFAQPTSAEGAERSFAQSETRA